MKYKRQILNVVTTICVFAGVLILWKVMSAKINNALFLPSPEETFEFWKQQISNNLLSHAWESFRRITIAVCSAEAIAIPLALLVVKIKFINKIVTPIVGFIKYIPLTAFIPLYILAMGLDERYKITLVATAVFLTYFPETKYIFENVNPQIMETSHTLGFSEWRNTWYIIIPYTFPELLIKFISAYGIGWTYVILAESSNTVLGLGHLMYIGNARGNMKMVFSALFTIIIINIVFDKLFSFIIKRAFKWRYKDNEQT